MKGAPLPVQYLKGLYPKQGSLENGGDEMGKEKQSSRVVQPSQMKGAFVGGGFGSMGSIPCTRAIFSA
jgi:hypothetical protein